jgi:PKHD-type hydroxylase
MAIEQPKELPQFQPYATASGFLTDAQIDGLLAEHASLVTEAKLAPGNANAEIRRSQVVMLGNEPKYAWLYERILDAAQQCNRLFFGVDIVGVEANLQLGRYDSSDRGFYGWHTDFAGIRPMRKLSVSVQLSRADDYEGGDLEIMYGTEPQKLDRTRGAFIVFPSFMLHRVTPVTRGTRWSLVAWVVGTRWR